MARPLITSMRVEKGERHDVLSVWTRGGKAGELVMDAGEDAAKLAQRLLRCGETGEEIPATVRMGEGWISYTVDE